MLPLKDANPLTQTIQALNSSLKRIGFISCQPNNSETIQAITFALVATAIVGIAVYHYIKKQEELN